MMIYTYTVRFLYSYLLNVGTLTVALSNSASEDVGDRGLIGLKDGELSTLETYSGSGTYKTCKKTFTWRFAQTEILTTEWCSISKYH